MPLLLWIFVSGLLVPVSGLLVPSADLRGESLVLIATSRLKEQHRNFEQELNMDRPLTSIIPFAQNLLDVYRHSQSQYEVSSLPRLSRKELRSNLVDLKNELDAARSTLEKAHGWIDAVGKMKNDPGDDSGDDSRDDSGACELAAALRVQFNLGNPA